MLTFCCGRIPFWSLRIASQGRALFVVVELFGGGICGLRCGHLGIRRLKSKSQLELLIPGVAEV
jgi:hypothetical protein